MEKNTQPSNPSAQPSVADKVKTIKQSFRLYMNGVTAQSLREKGAGCHLSWGASMQHLREMAAEYDKDYHLAVELWKQNVRECKLLAAMLMPAEDMPEEVCDIWMEDVPSQEIAEQLVFHLFQHLEYAPQIAFRYMASDDDMHQIVAFTLLGRIFMKGGEPDERGINEFLDQATVALQSESFGVKHAAMNCIIRFADLDPQYELIASKALKPLGIDIF